MSETCTGGHLIERMGGVDMAGLIDLGRFLEL